MKNLKEFNTYLSEKKGDKWIAGAVGKEGALRKHFGKKEGEKITKSEIQSEINKLKKKDKDPEKPGAQLSKPDAKLYKRLNLAKTLGSLTEDHGETSNYMFFANLMNIHRMCEDLLKMDPKVIDNILTNGHGWATDHVATSKDDIEEVYQFFNAEMMEKDPENEFHAEETPNMGMVTEE